MTDSDKVIGVRIGANSKDRIWGGYRIDYDDPRGIEELARLVGADEDGNSELISEDETLEDIPEIGTTAVKNPPAGYEGHEAKQDYQRKVMVEYEGEEDDGSGSMVRVTAARDAVLDILNSFDFAVSEPEDVYPPADEREAFEQWGADNGLDAPRAMAWNRAVEDLEAGNISQGDFERGKNPHRSEEVAGRRFDNAGQGRGN